MYTLFKSLIHIPLWTVLPRNIQCIDLRKPINIRTFQIHKTRTTRADLWPNKPRYLKSVHFQESQFSLKKKTSIKEPLQNSESRVGFHSINKCESKSKAKGGLFPIPPPAHHVQKIPKPENDENNNKKGCNCNGDYFNMAMINVMIIVVVSVIEYEQDKKNLKKK